MFVGDAEFRIQRITLGIEEGRIDGTDELHQGARAVLEALATWTFSKSCRIAIDMLEMLPIFQERRVGVEALFAFTEDIEHLQDRLDVIVVIGQRQGK